MTAALDVLPPPRVVDVAVLDRDAVTFGVHVVGLTVGIERAAVVIDHAMVDQGVGVAVGHESHVVVVDHAVADDRVARAQDEQSLISNTNRVFKARFGGPFSLWRIL